MSSLLLFNICPLVSVAMAVFSAKQSGQLFPPNEYDFATNQHTAITQAHNQSDDEEDDPYAQLVLHHAVVQPEPSDALKLVGQTVASV